MPRPLVPPDYCPQRAEALGERITELSAHINAANYRLLTLIREFDLAQGWNGGGLRSCAHWLNWKCGTSLPAAREKVRVAHALAKLPRISAVFRSGRVSYSKVRAMTRVATRENERHLVRFALCGTAAHVERIVRGYRRVQRIDALRRENARHAARELTWYEDDDGSVVFRLRLPPEQAALLRKGLDAAEDALAGERKDVSGETPEDGYVHEQEPCAARRADAMVRMAESYLAGENGSCGGDRYQVQLEVDAETLRADGAGAEARVPGHRCVSAETSRRVACDASLVAVAEAADGELLNVGRKRRTIPPSLRRALQRRDGGCRFPGCTAHRFVDAHHVVHWADGGETKLTNLVLLCRHHHRLVHEGGFGVAMAATGDLVFRDPGGRVVPPAAPARFRGNVEALRAEHADRGMQLDAGTTVPAWHGESLWDDLAVSALMHADRMPEPYG